MNNQFLIVPDQALIGNQLLIVNQHKLTHQIADADYCRSSPSVMLMMVNQAVQVQIQQSPCQP